MSNSAFSNWKRFNPEVGERVEEARASFYTNGDTVKTALAEDIAAETLRNGIEETTEVEKEVVIPTTGEIVTLTSIKTVKKPPPLKLVERYLRGDDYTDFSMIRMLVMQGYLPQSALTDFEEALLKFKQSIKDIVAPGSSTAAPVAPPTQEALVDAATRAVQRIFSEEHSQGNGAPVEAVVVSDSEPEA